MTNFFVYKAKITRFYKEFEAYFQIAFKFIIAFWVFGYVNSNLGFYKVLDNLGIQTVLSLISAIVPSSVFVLLVAILSILHLYKLSMIMMVLALVVFIVFYFLYLKFAPEHGILMMIIPVLMPLNLHFIVPLIAGLFFTPFTLIPIGCSFIMIKFVHYIIEAAPMLGENTLDITAIAQAYQYVIDHVLEDREMLLYICIFAIVIVLTYVISRLPFDYAWYVGIGVGTIASIVGMLIGSGMLDAQISNGGVILGSVIGGLVAALIQFMRCTVSYSRKEYVQFEDDDYYYYVKAVPKIYVSNPEKNVRTFDDVFLKDASSETIREIEHEGPSAPVKGTKKPSKRRRMEILQKIREGSGAASGEDDWDDFSDTSQPPEMPVQPVSEEKTHAPKTTVKPEVKTADRPNQEIKAADSGYDPLDYGADSSYDDFSYDDLE